MIGYISGTVKGVIRDTAVITVGTPENGILGYRIHVLASTLAGISDGDPLSLWTHLAVRENSQNLYGFGDKDELQWFELLLSVSGIGPRSALSILNSVDIATLQGAILQNDASILSRAVGVGKKTAEKIVLELREKVEPTDEYTASGSDGEIIEALVSLGYSLKEARDAARATSKDLTSVEDRIREALRLISGTR